jgi:6-phosphogluconolactonase
LNWKRTFMLAIAVAGSTSITQAQSSAWREHGRGIGFVYTETNGTPNNAILAFNRATNGELSLAATVPTGGVGGGVVAVGSQGALALARDARWLFAANEGDNSISVLERTPTGLRLAQRVYPIPDSTRPLSAVPSPAAPAVGPVAAEIHFDNTGRFLYVAEVGTSLIDRYLVDYFGIAEGPETENSFGNAPFAFAFDPWNNLLVTEISESRGAANIGGKGAVSSYRLNFDGFINMISGSVPDFRRVRGSRSAARSWHLMEFAMRCPLYRRLHSAIYLTSSNTLKESETLV